MYRDLLFVWQCFCEFNFSSVQFNLESFQRRWQKSGQCGFFCCDFFLQEFNQSFFTCIQWQINSNKTHIFFKYQNKIENQKNMRLCNVHQELGIWQNFDESYKTKLKFSNDISTYRWLMRIVCRIHIDIQQIRYIFWWKQDLAWTCAIETVLQYHGFRHFVELAMQVIWLHRHERYFATYCVYLIFIFEQKLMYVRNSTRTIVAIQVNRPAFLVCLNTQCE